MGCGDGGSVRARALFRGGNANNGANAGIGYVNVNNVVGNANTNYGGRLSACDKVFTSTPYAHHRTQGELFIQ